MTLDCTKISKLKLERYKLAKLKDARTAPPGAPSQTPEKPIDFLSIQNNLLEAIDDDEVVNLDDVTSFLEKDVKLDHST